MVLSTGEGGSELHDTHAPTPAPGLLLTVQVLGHFYSLLGFVSSVFSVIFVPLEKKNAGWLQLEQIERMFQAEKTLG